MQVGALLATAAALLAAPTARADGDPASDVLPVADVFLPQPPPQKAVAAALQKAVDAANTGGNRLKVAVIAARTDLGAIPSLFGKPTAYARFLGTELGTFYSGVLLVVMPAGFGVYDHGRPTAADEAALKGLATAQGADALAQAAEAAVRRLAAAKALHYTDVLPPIVYAAAGSTIQYAVADDSGKAAVTVTVLLKKKRILVTSKPLSKVNPVGLYTVKWQPPPGGASGYRYCVVAVDPSGNRSTPSCAALSTRG